MFGLLPWQMADLYPDELRAISEWVDERNKAYRKAAR